MKTFGFSARTLRGAFAALLIIPLGACNPSSDSAGSAESTAPKSAVASASQTAQAAQPAQSSKKAKPKTFAAKGIYMTATSIQIDRFHTMTDNLVKSGGNMVVFDVKNEDGIVSYKSQVPMVKQIGADKEGPIHDLKTRVKQMHDKGIHVAGRIVLFKDPILAKARPDLTLKSQSTGKPWLDKGKLQWLDPNHPEVIAYNLALANELAEMGVDEIQFDYVRFPAESKTSDIAYSFDTEKTPKHEIITAFMKKANEALKPKGVLISIDVFGVIAWNKDIDQRITGQKVEDLAKYVDVMCPMVYPSHFGTIFDGKKNPADHPTYFVEEGVKKLYAKIDGSGAVVRPWIQGFGWRVTNFGPGYVGKQIDAAKDAKAVGYMVWNASNKYEPTWKAMSAR
ncbi:hypothetical protein D3C87_645800 [compost metagenome]